MSWTNFQSAAVTNYFVDAWATNGLPSYYRARAQYIVRKKHSTDLRLQENIASREFDIAPD